MQHPEPAPYADTADWVARTHAAAERLIAEHNYRREDFVTIGEDDDVTLDFSPGQMPDDWGEHVRRDEDGTVVSGWVREDCVPVGLTLFWPQGTDWSGEAHDPLDPEWLLRDIEFWMQMTTEEIRALENETVSDPAPS